MRANEFLIEAKGIFGRNAGDPFEHTNGTTAEFVEIQSYPGATHGKYESVEARDEMFYIGFYTMTTRLYLN